jgi:hypothetical protein
MKGLHAAARAASYFGLSLATTDDCSAPARLARLRKPPEEARKEGPLAATTPSDPAAPGAGRAARVPLEPLEYASIFDIDGMDDGLPTRPLRISSSGRVGC